MPRQPHSVYAPVSIKPSGQHGRALRVPDPLLVQISKIECCARLLPSWLVGFSSSRGKNQA
jgi:hypothetical protein